MKLQMINPTDTELKDAMRVAPKHVCVALAARNVLRAIPRLLPLKDGHSLFLILRATISALAEAKFVNEPDFSLLGYDAGELLDEYINLPENSELGPLHYSIASAAIEAAQGSAFRCLKSVEILGPEYRREFNVDHQRAGSILEAPLFAKIRDVDRFKLSSNLGVKELDFWIRWHASFIDGKPLPWGLQRAVVQIPEKIWRAGPASVAEEIRKLEFEYYTSSNQRLVRNQSRGQLQVEEDTALSGEVLDFVLKRISSALNAALKSTGENEFSERCYEAIVLRGVLDLEDASISDLATSIFDAALSLQQNIGSLYPKDAALSNLANALAAVTDELCALDDKARERCALLAGYQPQKTVDNLSPDDLAKVPELVSGQVDEVAQVILERDIDQVLDQSKPTTRVVRMRLSNWLSTISIWMDRAMKGDKKAKWISEIVKRLRDWWNES